MDDVDYSACNAATPSVQNCTIGRGSSRPASGRRAVAPQPREEDTNRGPFQPTRRCSIIVMGIIPNPRSNRMYTVKKIEEPDRGTLYAVGAGDSIVSRWTDEAEAKEACTQLNGGEAAEKKLATAEKKAEEDAKKVAEADQKSRAAAKPAAAKSHDDEPKPRAHAAKAKAHVKRMTPKPTRRHK